MKKTYWKLVTDEYPGGEIFIDRVSALQQSHEYHSDGLKAYVRAIKMTEEEYEELKNLGL